MLLDRFVDSSLAYQGGGRELGIEAIREINEFATGGLRPDRTLLLSIDPALGRARSRARSEPLDRLEREDERVPRPDRDRVRRARGRRARPDPHDRRDASRPSACSPRRSTRARICDLTSE